MSMMSPDVYYEFYLKDKSSEEILSAIHELENKIKDLEQTPEDLFCIIDPSVDVRISCNKEYLKRAIQALSELGVEYESTKNEGEM